MLSACGISGFWSSHFRIAGESTHTSFEGPLSGQLKTYPGDFIVVEVDPAGQRCDAADFDFARAVDTAVNVTDETGDSVPDDIARQGSEQDGVVDEATEEKANSSSASLQEPLSERLSSLLDELDVKLNECHCTLPEVVERSRTLSPVELRTLLVDTIRTSVGAAGNRNRDGAAVPAATGASPRCCWWEETIPLAVNLSKEERRLLHFAVRSRYSHIRSVGQQTSQKEASLGGEAGKMATPHGAEDVCAGVDPLFVFLTALFGEAVASTLAQWSQVKATVGARAKMSQDETDALDRLEWGQREHSGKKERQTLPTKVMTSFPSAATVSGDEEGEGALSEKDVRRAFHEIMRRFFGFVRCQVRDGTITMSFSPPTLRQTFSGARAGAAVDDGNGKRERGELGSGDVAQRQGKRCRADTQENRVEGYLYGIVRKHNLDTMEMKSLLAAAYGVREGAICMAGMKDKRAITYQRVSMPLYTLPSQEQQAFLASTTPGTRLPWPSDPEESYMEVCRLSSSVSERFAKPIQLGELKGNHFTIVLRNIHSAAPLNATSTSVAPTAAEVAAALRSRLTRVAAHGFVNFFGQQRFSESATDLLDHTGLHLFAGRYVAAVKSLFRAHPEVYAGFPETMDARHVPRNSRDCVAMAHALRQTYRMYFSEHPLTSEDVRAESLLWQRICEKAVCESVPFPLRSLWVHSGQSLFFNVAASAAAHALAEKLASGEHDAEATQRLAAQLYLPMAGYRVVHRGSRAEDGKEDADTQSTLAELAHLAETHALEVLGLSRSTVFAARRVAGIPVPGSWRRAFVMPLDTELSLPDVSSLGDGPVPEATLSFFLPSSSYATVCLREVLGTDEWW